jgi:hypothetical protein
VAYSGGYTSGYGDAVAPEVAFAGIGTFTVTVAGPSVVFAGAGTFTATAGTVSFAATVRFPGGSTFTVSATAGAAVSFSGTGTLRVSVELDYRVDVVDRNGSVFGTLANARIGKYSYELNGVGSADITLATTDPDAYLVRPGREIQIWRNGILQWWGPVVRPQAGLRETTWQCASLLWYFEHRFMGRADRTNLLTNGDFEAGEASWTFSGGVTHSVDTTLTVEGTQSLLLGGATADHTGHATQTIPAWGQYHPQGDYLTVSCWVWIPSSTYLGGAISDLGLVAVHRNGAGETIDAQFATIDDDTLRDQWLPLEVGIAAVKTGDTVEVKLFPPHGTAYFDLVTVTAMESLSFPAGTDIARIVEGIVLYAQDQHVFTHGKSDLNIGFAGADTGETRQGEFAYQFVEHRNILDAILEPVRQGLIDIDIEISPSTRTFRTYAPRKGSLSAIPLVLDENLADFTWSWDGENAASTVIVLGEGDGPDRAEGVATDPTFLDGLSLELVESAPDDATVGDLDAVAAERLTVAAHPEIVEVTTLPGAGIIGNLTTGDTVTLRIHHGWVNIDTTYRVARIDIDPYHDQAALTLNPAP